MKELLKDIRIKLKEIFLPFLAVSIGTLLFYSVFRWIFDIQLRLLPLKEDLLNIWIPMFLPWIPILTWLRRRTKILKVKNKDNGHFYYQLAMVLAIAVPLIVSQAYIEKASFKLVSLNNILEVQDKKNDKYFDIKEFKASKDNSLSYITARTSGKNNNNLEFYLYLSCPFENSENVWYGIEFNKNLSNRISNDKKDSEYNSFLENSEREFNLYDFQNVMYFEKLGYSDDRDGFIEAIKEKYSNINESEQIILVPKTDVFESRLGNTFFWIFGSFGIGASFVLLLITISKIDNKELRDFKKNKPIKNDELKETLKYLDLREPNKATTILLLLNIAVFIAMTLLGLNIISPTTKELLEIGGNRRIEVMNGEYWRLLTSVFIHGGLLHLITNLLGLAIGAGLLEKIIGRFKLIISFIICGILASVTSIYWHENTVSIGASGAIFGLYGIILAFSIFKIYPNIMLITTWGVLVLYIGVGLLFGLLGDIDNAAHLGGLISGFILGLVLILTEKDKLIKNAKNNT